MKAGVTNLRAAGVSTVVLWVTESNAVAQAFYRAVGFAPDGDRKLTGLDKSVPIIRWRLG